MDNQPPKSARDEMLEAAAANRPKLDAAREHDRIVGAALRLIGQEGHPINATDRPRQHFEPADQAFEDDVTLDTPAIDEPGVDSAVPGGDSTDSQGPAVDQPSIAPSQSDTDVRPDHGWRPMPADLGLPGAESFAKALDTLPGGDQPQRDAHPPDALTVRLDKPPSKRVVIDFKDYNWQKRSYERDFIQNRVIQKFSLQIRKYKTIRPQVHFQFSNQPPQWVVEAIGAEGASYSVVP